MSDLTYKISVMQAALEGKKIEYRSRVTGGDWIDVTQCPAWAWDAGEYRITPEPRKPREWWLFLKDGHMEVCEIGENCHDTRPHVRVREVIEE